MEDKLGDSDVTLISGKERDMIRTPLFTYDSAKGLLRESWIRGSPDSRTVGL